MNGGSRFLATAAVLALAGCGGSQAKLQIRPTPSPLSATAKPVPIRIAEARGHLALGNVALAIESFRKALREQPESIDAMAGLAAGYDRMGRFDLSRRYYESALAVSPADTVILAAFAQSLTQQGRVGEAAAVRREIDVRLAAASPLGVPAKPMAALGKPAATNSMPAPARSVTVKLAPPRPVPTAVAKASGPKAPAAAPAVQANSALPAAPPVVAHRSAMAAPAVASRPSPPASAKTKPPAPPRATHVALAQPAVAAMAAAARPVPVLTTPTAAPLAAAPVVVATKTGTPARVSLAPAIEAKSIVPPPVAPVVFATKSAHSAAKPPPIVAEPKPAPSPAAPAPVERTAVAANVASSSTAAPVAIARQALGSTAAAAPSAAPVAAGRKERTPLSPEPKSALRLERTSLGEVALITTGQPKWRPQPVTRTALSSTIRFVPLRKSATRPVQIRVLNAARHHGLAARTRTLLAQRGWRQMAIGNAYRVRRTSLILYPANRRKTAERLAAQFGFRIAKRASGGDLVLLLGRDAAKRPVG